MVSGAAVVPVGAGAGSWGAGAPPAGSGAGVATAAGAQKEPGHVGSRSVHPGRIRPGSVNVRPSDMTDPLLACQMASHAPPMPYSRWAILLRVSPGATT